MVEAVGVAFLEVDDVRQPGLGAGFARPSFASSLLEAIANCVLQPKLSFCHRGA